MVLLTGATGLVGSHVALHLLEKSESVRAIFRTTESQLHTKKVFAIYGREDLFDAIEWISADINDIPALEKAFPGVTEVYHCAAYISFDGKEEEKLRKTNIEGTANIVNFSIAYGIRKLCYVSSIAALGDLKDHESLITEETEWNPEKHHSDYAISKYGAEMEVWRAQQEGLETIIVNPGVILGPGFSDGSSEIFSVIADDLPFYTKGSTGFVAVTDVAAILYRLMKSEISGERYTLIAGNYVFQDIANSVAEAMHAKKPSIHAKPWMTSLSWRLDWFLAALLKRKRKMFHETARALHGTDLYSNEKITKELDFTFIDITAYIPKVVALRN